VAWWTAEGRDIDRARWALRLQRLEVVDREDPFAAIIRCTADPAKADKRSRSRGAGFCATRPRTSWSRWVGSSSARAASTNARVVSLGASGEVRQQLGERARPLSGSTRAVIATDFWARAKDVWRGGHAYGRSRPSAENPQTSWPPTSKEPPPIPDRPAREACWRVFLNPATGRFSAPMGWDWLPLRIRLCAAAKSIL
jgi:hypothetical protein